MHPVTLSQVAAHAGVSLTTASRVLNGSTRHPAQSIVGQVQRSAAVLGYVPNAHAQALARSSTHLIGVLVEDLAHPTCAAFLQGVALAAQQANREVLLLLSGKSDAQQISAVRSCGARRTEAIIFVHPHIPALSEGLTAQLHHYAENIGVVLLASETSPDPTSLDPWPYLRVHLSDISSDQNPHALGQQTLRSVVKAYALTNAEN